MNDWLIGVVTLGVARDLGIPVVVGSTLGKGARWDGSVLRLEPFAHRNDLAHEIGHWLVATHDERTRSDWGCTRAYPVPCEHWLDEDTATLRENQAELIGGLIERVVEAAIRELWHMGTAAKIGGK